MESMPMKKSVNVFALALLACSALAFAAGWGASRLSTPAVAVPVAGPAEPAASPAELLARFQAVDWRSPGGAGDELAPALAGNPALREAALARFRQEQEMTPKYNLLNVLRSGASPELAGIALDWAQRSDSAAARRDGFLLMHAVPTGAQGYRLARQALDHEADPAALAAALRHLQPDEVAHPADVQQVVPRLHVLTQHPFADLRSASVQALAGWDHANRHIANDVLRLLADPDPEVRIAAIGASSIASLKSDPIKKRLLGLLNDPSQMLDVRSVALMNLDRFAFTPDEHADLMAGKRQLEDDAKKP
jgi:hypothetical protein